MAIDVKELISKAVKELVAYKKETGKSWNLVIRWLPDVDPFFDELFNNDPTSYRKLQEEILEKAKAEFDSEIGISKGIAVQKERWCFPDSIYRDYYWKKYKEMMSGWTETRWKTVESQTFEIVNYLTDPKNLLASGENNPK